MANDLNVLVGAGVLKVGADEASAVDVGYTSDGVTISFARDYYDVEVDQSINIIKKAKIKEIVTLTTNLVEASLENLKTVLDIGNAIEDITGPPDYKKLSFGGDAGIGALTLVFSGTAPTGKERKFVAYKAISVEAGEHSYKKDDKTIIPVKFELVADTSKADGEQLGYYQDEQ